MNEMKHRQLVRIREEIGAMMRSDSDLSLDSRWIAEDIAMMLLCMTKNQIKKEVFDLYGREVKED